MDYLLQICITFDILLGLLGQLELLLRQKMEIFSFSDFRYKTQATKQVSEMGFEFVEVSRGSLQTVGEYIKKFGLKNVGFEDVNVAFSLYQTIKDIFKVELVPVGNKLVMERMVKSEEEIALIKKAVEISDVAFSEALKIIKEGVSEKEVSSYMEYIQRKLGADDRSFTTIFASGYRSAMPHGVASEQKNSKGRIYYNGFWGIL